MPICTHAVQGCVKYTYMKNRDFIDVMNLIVYLVMVSCVKKYCLRMPKMTSTYISKISGWFSICN